MYGSYTVIKKSLETLKSFMDLIGELATAVVLSAAAAFQPAKSMVAGYSYHEPIVFKN